VVTERNGIAPDPNPPQRERQWAPLVALRIEAVVKVDPSAGAALTIIDGDGSFRFAINQHALDAAFNGPVGTSIHVRSDPAFAPFPEVAGAASLIDWSVDRYVAADTRVYDCVVSRPAQVWWTPRRQIAGRVEGAGWPGRWGPRVTNDPNNRRAGGKCPDFVAMFLEAIALTL
jgi:hypothetical protein